MNSNVTKNRSRRGATRVTTEEHKTSYFLDLQRIESRTSKLNKEFDMRGKLSLNKMKLTNILQKTQSKLINHN